MSPNEQALLRRIEVLEQQVRQFTNQSELDPQIIRTIKLTAAGIELDSTGSISGLSQTVNEGGAASYGVASEYDGSLVVQDAEGNQYKLGYYTA